MGTDGRKAPSNNVGIVEYVDTVSNGGRLPTDDVEPNRSNKITNWKNEPDISDLLVDLENANIYQTKYIQDLDSWQETYDGGMVIDKEDLRSNYRDKLVRKQSEWRYPLVEEPLLNTPNIFNVIATNSDSLQGVNPNKELLNYQWNTLIPKQQLINTASRNFVNEGTAIIKLGWDFEYDEVERDFEEPIYAETEDEIKSAIVELSKTEELTDELVLKLMNKELFIRTGTKKLKETVIDIKKNQPKYTVVDNESLYIDPECRGVLDDCTFMIEEIQTMFATLKANERRTIKYTDKKTGKVVKKKVGHYHNLDAVKAYLTDKSKQQESLHTAEANMFNDFINPTSTLKQKLIMYEYWGYADINDTGKLVPIIASWVGDILIRMEENPYPHKEFPYSIASFMPRKHDLRGEPNAELISSNQEMISSITRGIHDITLRGAIGQTFINEDLFSDTVQKNNFKKGKTVWYTGFIDPEKAIYRSKPEEVPQSMLHLIDLQKQDAEQLTGVIPYNTSMMQRPKTDITGSKKDDDATTQRDMGILRRFLDMIKDLGRKTIRLNQEYITDDTLITLIGSAENFRIINEEDLKGKFFTEVKISTPQKNDGVANKLLTMMQTNAANMSPTLANLHYIKLAELWNQDELAKEIRDEMNAPPDPMQQKMQELQVDKLELENKLTQMQLLISRANLVEMSFNIDATAKELASQQTMADTELTKAHASKLAMQTALFRQELEYIQSGLKMKEERLFKEYQHAANLEREKVRTDRELALNNEKHKNALEKDQAEVPTINHSVDSTKQTMNSTLYTPTSDGSKGKYYNIGETKGKAIENEIDAMYEEELGNTEEDI